jgi:catechol 2,3-dioxygenase-like lactoylglutathione lyase family enzyme
MARGLDHIVHAVRDLDAAADVYGRLGFTVGARNRHPCGTHNRLVQLSGFFIELLTLAEPDKLGSDGFSQNFGRYNQDFLARHEGLSLVILETRDAASTAAEFAAAGILASDVVRLAREGRRPDGSAVQLAFSLAFARDAAAPGLMFAACQHHFPENFWNPAFQVHANKACGIGGAVMVADNPADHHIFLSAFVGERDLAATSSGIVVSTPRGDIAVMAADAFAPHYGVAAPDVSGGPRLAAIRIEVADMAATVRHLQASGVPAEMRMGRIVVPPSAAMGATLVFELATH